METTIMESWIYFLLPILMVVFGIWFIKIPKMPPEKPNIVVGYRTAKSSKNKDTWTFAHRYFGKLLLIAGVILLILSVVAVIFMPNSKTEIIGWIFIVIQTVIGIIVPIILTEKALNANFDNAGNRRL